MNALPIDQAQKLLDEINRQVGSKLNEFDARLGQTQVALNQVNQINETYRQSIYALELQKNLLLKLLEDQGTMAKGSFEQQWPLYLENVVGVVGKDGKMKGELKVTFYDN
jgi:hypothetical protein